MYWGSALGGLSTALHSLIRVAALPFSGSWTLLDEVWQCVEANRTALVLGNQGAGQ